MKFGFLALWLSLLSLSATHADDWARADVYFIEWDAATRISLTPERVRQQADYRQTFVNDAPAVRKLLQLQKLKPSREQRPEDARVVIDYTDDDARRHTIYLSYFHLCTGDSRLKRPIDGQFRQRISRLAKHRRVR